MKEFILKKRKDLNNYRVLKQGYSNRFIKKSARYFRTNFVLSIEKLKIEVIDLI